MLSIRSKPKAMHFGKMPALKLQVLQERLIQFAFFNLLLVALLGVLLRAFPFLSLFPFSYKNVLHGHSHFAFGGWVMPILLALILKYFPEISQKVKYKHWRNITVLLLAAAYGMLVSFPIQGYKLVSIFFSTLSVAAGYYMAIVVCQAVKNIQKTPSIRFLQWGLIYLSISAIGPFATGPLIVMGYQGTPLYFNAVYFYLHFQYNGWFTFAVLAILYQLLQEKKCDANGKLVFRLLNIACIPTFFLSILWHKPGLVYNLIGGLGAILQLIAVVYLLFDLRAFNKRDKFSKLLIVSIAVFCIKIALQVISAVPVVAVMVYQFRNFVIAYLHLVLLGFISLFALAIIIKANSVMRELKCRVGVLLFLFSFFSTESLLVLQAWGSMKNFAIPNYQLLLLLCSTCFPLSILLLFQLISKTSSKRQFLLGKLSLS